MSISMTGFGESSGDFNGSSCSVQVRGYNNRGLDVKIKMPTRINTFAFEGEVKNAVASSVTRGRVELALTVSSENGIRNQLNDETLVRFRDYLESLENKLGRRLEIKLGDVISFHNETAVTIEEDNRPLQEFMLALLGKALEEFVSFKKTEGAELAKSLAQLVGDCLEKLMQIESEIDASKMQALERLKSNLNLASPNADTEALVLRELGTIIDKLDITEEVVRLRSHLDKATSLIKSNEPYGKSLEFICQEFVREANTICSKTNLVSIKEGAIAIKTNAEKIKEQAMNFE